MKNLPAHFQADGGLFVPDTFGNQVRDQEPEQPLDEKKQKPQPAHSLKPKTKPLIHTARRLTKDNDKPNRDVPGRKRPDYGPHCWPVFYRNKSSKITLT
jgi:hypothetical protein